MIVYRVDHTTDGRSLLTLSEAEAQGASRFGFGPPTPLFHAAAEAAPGLVEVRRVFNPQTHDFMHLRPDGAEWAAVVGITHTVAAGDTLWGLARRYNVAVRDIQDASGLGTSTLLAVGQRLAIRRGAYQDQENPFWVSPSGEKGTVPVWRLARGPHHRFALPAELTALQAAGWRQEGIAWWAEPATPRTRLHLHVHPDTQQEDAAGDPRYAARAAYALLERPDGVTQVGDPWKYLDTPNTYGDREPRVERFAGSFARPIVDEDILLTCCEGNHGTAACVGPGYGVVPGSANPVTGAAAGLRDTRDFDAALAFTLNAPGTRTCTPGSVSTSIRPVPGTVWWMATLEMWARPDRLEWLAQQIEALPDGARVQLTTHMMLDESLRLPSDAGGYGATSPAAMWARLKRSGKVRVVCSGHVGLHGATVIDGAVFYLTTFHSNESAPLRSVLCEDRDGRMVATSWLVDARTKDVFGVTQHTIPI